MIASDFIDMKSIPIKWNLIVHTYKYLLMYILELLVLEQIRIDQNWRLVKEVNDIDKD